MNKLQFIFLSVIVSLSAYCCKENDTTLKDEYVNEWIKTTIDSVIAEHNISAFSISISRNGIPTYIESFGTSKRDTSAKINETSIYPINLFSKTFTGIIINSLIDEGKLNYDEPISTYLSDVLTEQALESFKNIPLKNILHHKSGITDNDCSFYKNKYDGEALLAGYTSAQLVEDLNQIKIDSDDHSYKYSNFGYAIIGYICEKISGKSYATLLKEYVTDKYDLPNTVIHLNDEQKRLLISPYRQDNNQKSEMPLNKGTANAADGVYSNIIDLSKLQKNQLKSYQEYFERGIANPLILTERSVRSRIDNWKYGMGFMEIINDNGRYYGYYRNANGYSSVYLFSAYPAVGMTVLTTSGGLWLGEFALTIMDGLVDDKRILHPRKRSLAWTMFSVIDTEGISSGLNWFKMNNGSKKYKLVEAEMNIVGYRLLREQNVKEAIEVFKLNVAEFPESSNVYDSLGEAYAEDDNDELAIANYQKSLDLDPDNSRAKRILKRLTSQE